MKRFFFLLKSNSPALIFLSYFKHKIINIFIKRKIIKLKKKHEHFIEDKKISNNFFYAHAYNFFYYLSKLKSNFDYLEIGSYEGNSAIFVSKNFKSSSIYCVDNWEMTEEYMDHKSSSKIEQNFDYNISIQWEEEEKNHTFLEEIKKDSKIKILKIELNNHQNLVLGKVHFNNTIELNQYYQSLKEKLKGCEISIFYEENTF